MTTDLPAEKPSPFAIGNIRLFIAFRVCFNSRFYYPVFTILFLDFGLTLEQFALLNAAWAATIVLLEVPSGALADVIGRRNLLVLAGALMVIEIGLLCVVPRGRPGLLLTAFLINRVLSGAAEAAASGADEAIAYDSLKASGRAHEWPRVLETLVRVQSAAFIFAMSLGAAVYDPQLVQTAARWLGFDVGITQGMTLRLPLLLTLVMAVLTLLTALRMKEVGGGGRAANRRTASAATLVRLTLQAGKWILQSPFASVLILAGLLFDSCVRMLITLNSQYYRAIEIPEGVFGLIGSAFAVLGFFIPRLARRMAEGLAPQANLLVMVLIALAGLWGLRFFWPLIGLVPVALLIVVMYLNNFFLSHYLNRLADSGLRATILSFKGLSFNLAYGLIGILYSLLLAILRGRVRSGQPELGAQLVENMVFETSIGYFPWYFMAAMAVLLIFARRRLRGGGPF